MKAHLQTLAVLSALALLAACQGTPGGAEGVQAGAQALTDEEEACAPRDNQAEAPKPSMRRALSCPEGLTPYTPAAVETAHCGYRVAKSPTLTGQGAALPKLQGEPAEYVCRVAAPCEWALTAGSDAALGCQQCPLPANLTAPVGKLAVFSLTDAVYGQLAGEGNLIIDETKRPAKASAQELAVWTRKQLDFACSNAAQRATMEVYQADAKEGRLKEDAAAFVIKFNKDLGELGTQCSALIKQGVDATITLRTDAEQETERAVCCEAKKEEEAPLEFEELDSAPAEHPPVEAPAEPAPVADAPAELAPVDDVPVVVAPAEPAPSDEARLAL